MLNQKAQERYEGLLEARKRLFERLESCKVELLKNKPAADKWNVLQIVHHIYLAERGTVNYMIKKLHFSKGELPKAGFASHLKTILLQTALRTPLKMKAPAGLDAVSGDISLDELSRQWNALDHEFLGFLMGLSEKQLASQLFRHPFIGRINMTDTLKFLHAHFDHHLSQINKLIR